jgi:predicted nucleotidyltransferase
MRTSTPDLLPLFRSEMQLRLLGLVLLQPERTWTLQELNRALTSPLSSVHRELARAERAGLIVRETSVRPHRFRAAEDEPLVAPLAELLRHTIGVEIALRAELADRPEVLAAVIHGPWAAASRSPGSAIDVFVVGDVDLRDLRRRLRPVGEAAGRTLDIIVLAPDEFRRLARVRTSFTRRVLEEPTTALVGDLRGLVRKDGRASRATPAPPQT